MTDIALQEFEVDPRFTAKRGFEIVSSIYPDFEGSVLEYDHETQIILEHQSDVTKFIYAAQTLIDITFHRSQGTWIKGIFSQNEKNQQFCYDQNTINLPTMLQKEFGWQEGDSTPFLRIDSSTFSCAYEEEGRGKHIAILCTKDPESAVSLQNEFVRILSRTPTPNAGHNIRRALG